MGLRIGIVTFPIGKAGVIPLTNLVRILLEQTDEPLNVLTGNEGVQCGELDKRVKLVSIPHRSRKGYVSRFLSYLVTQARFSLQLMRLHRKVDVWYFYIGGQLQLLQMVTAKLLGGEVLLSFPCSSSNDARSQKVNYVHLIELIVGINCMLSDKIVVASRELACNFNLMRYSQKLCFAHEYFFDSQLFHITSEYKARANVIGFIGRLSEEKGIINFLEALPMILDQREDVTCVIGGDGPLRERVSRFIEEKGLGAKVSAVGWIDHSELPDYLNRFKLLVIPSYTEAGPIIAYEAMGCGTPILATRVGFVMDKIEDNETGFILKNNTPACISERVIEALSSDNLETVSRKGYDLALKEFSFDRARDNYARLLKLDDAAHPQVSSPSSSNTRSNFN